MNHGDYLVTIDVPPSLEEPFIDCLLGFKQVHCIASFPVGDHDRPLQGLSLAEQVFGKQRNIRFQLNIEKNSLADLLIHLKTEFSDAGLQYWVVPVIEHGEI